MTEILSATTNDLLPNRTVDTWIEFLSVNLRDQIRREDFETDGTPVQFLYDAANCRIFYTVDTWSNYSQLWRYAVRAIDDPFSLCVKGSTSFAYTSVTGLTATPPPPSSPMSNYNASPTYGTSNQFTNFLPPNLELAKFTQSPILGGLERVPTTKQACNNHGKGCTVGRCQNRQSEHRTGIFNGKTIEFESGTCPVNTAASSGYAGLSTKVDEPAEIIGNGGVKKEVSSLGNIIWRVWGKASRR